MEDPSGDEKIFDWMVDGKLNKLLSCLDCVTSSIVKLWNTLQYQKNNPVVIFCNKCKVLPGKMKCSGCKSVRYTITI